ncbi:MAG: AAA family ATPase, partial [Lachnospiraceae bacterium]
MNRLKTILINGQVIFPGEVIGFSADDREKLKIQLEAYDNDEELFLLRFKSDNDTERKNSERTETNGVIAKVESVNSKDNGITEVLVRALRRGRLKSINHLAPNEYEADVEEYVESEEGFERMIRSLHLTMRGYSDVNERFRKNFLNDLLAIKYLPNLLDGLRLALNLNYEKRKIINAAKTPIEESMLLMEIMSEAIDRKEISDRIKSEVDKDISKNQRDYILREHLKVIQNEMAKNSGYETVTDEYEEKLENIKLADEYKEKLKKDILRLNTSANNGPEGNVIRTYLDTVFEMPFGKSSEDFNDILHAGKILDADHYGLEKVKDRILEYLSVRILNPTGNSPILCLVGPPGTGKTSIAKSVAKALGRKYVRISLGGVGDEAEIRGHRRTYVGAMPGRIVEAIKNAKVENPLLLLDEIDKTSRDYKGDVSSALLEVLDGEQNKTFRDRYLEIPLDLSKV